MCAQANLDGQQNSSRGAQVNARWGKKKRTWKSEELSQTLTKNTIKQLISINQSLAIVQTARAAAGPQMLCSNRGPMCSCEISSTTFEK